MKRACLTVTCLLMAACEPQLTLGPWEIEDRTFSVVGTVVVDGVPADSLGVWAGHVRDPRRLERRPGPVYAVSDTVSEIFCGLLVIAVSAMAPDGSWLPSKEADIECGEQTVDFQFAVPAG